MLGLDCKWQKAANKFPCVSAIMYCGVDIFYVSRVDRFFVECLCLNLCVSKIWSEKLKRKLENSNFTIAETVSRLRDRVFPVGVMFDILNSSSHANFVFLMETLLILLWCVEHCAVRCLAVYKVTRLNIFWLKHMHV